MSSRIVIIKDRKRCGDEKPLRMYGWRRVTCCIDKDMKPDKGSLNLLETHYHLHKHGGSQE